jgi:hypothetical protein
MGFLFLQRALSPLPLLLLEARGKTAYGIRAHLYTAQFFADAYHIRLGFVGKAGPINAY